MKRISFSTRFVNEVGDDLIPGKIHTIRQNYDYWKRFEGKDIAPFYWEGKPYRSKQKVFCVKRLVSVQSIGVTESYENEKSFYALGKKLSSHELSVNDGFQSLDLFDHWFDKYPTGQMAILHFTGFRY